jgi:membrane protein
MRMRARDAFEVLKRSVKEFGADEAITRSAALAYYTALSMAPLVVLLLWFAALFGEAAQESLINEIQSLIGPQGGEAVQLVVKNAAARPDLGGLAGVISLVTLVFAATAVFGELQAALNRIWHVQAKPGLGLLSWVRKRVISMGMVLSVFFLLLVSTAVSAVLSASSKAIFGSSESILLETVHFLVSILVFGASFALLYRHLPDAKIARRDGWIGGFTTAFLFVLGKLGVGIYLGRSSVGSAYGAAGSLIVLLVWAYYSAIVFFFGAEVTRVFAEAQGRAIRPDEHAVEVPAAAGVPSRA